LRLNHLFSDYLSHCNEKIIAKIEGAVCKYFFNDTYELMLRTPFELTWKNLRIKQKHANVANAQYGGGNKTRASFFTGCVVAAPSLIHPVFNFHQLATA
jgi:hypothetical protein